MSKASEGYWPERGTLRAVLSRRRLWSVLFAPFARLGIARSSRRSRDLSGFVKEKVAVSVCGFIASEQIFAVPSNHSPTKREYP